MERILNEKNFSFYVQKLVRKIVYTNYQTAYRINEEGEYVNIPYQLMKMMNAFPIFAECMKPKC